MYKLRDCCGGCGIDVTWISAEVVPPPLIDVRCLAKRGDLPDQVGQDFSKITKAGLCHFKARDIVINLSQNWKLEQPVRMQCPLTGDPNLRTILPYVTKFSDPSAVPFKLLINVFE